MEVLMEEVMVMERNVGYCYKAKGADDAAKGIVAESPEPSRSAARTCSGKPDPPKGGGALLEKGIRG